MEPGLKLKAVREKLGLRFREVEKASNLIAQRHKSADFAIGLSRLADMENKGVVPNLHRLYSLCAIYRLDMNEVLGWYGIDVEDIRAVNPKIIYARGTAHGAKGPDHAACAKRCAKGGQPIGLLADDGAVYLLYANHEDGSAFEATKELAGTKVMISGKKFEKDGITGIEVNEVKAL